MSCKPGAYLGGIRTLEDLRLRCVCRADDDCWHLRTARGKPMPVDERHSVSIHGIGSMTATRAAWMLAGKTLRKGFVIFRACESYDCVNPAHLKFGTRGAVARNNAAMGRCRTPGQLATLEASRKRRTKATPEHVRLIVESQLPAPALALVVPLSCGRINSIRREWAAKPVKSVWDLGRAA